MLTILPLSLLAVEPVKVYITTAPPDCFRSDWNR